MANEHKIQELLKRDEPMAMGRYFWKTEEFKNDPPADLCGNCSRVLGSDFVFCPRCGQRIDHENYML